METEKDTRIDKYLWSIRVFKTRSQATDACRKGWVLMNNMPVKPSREIKEGDVIDVRQNPIYRKLKILQVLHNRVGAKLVPQYVEDITPPEELKKLELMKSANDRIIRERGTGRPTKKERRELDDYFDW